MDCIIIILLLANLVLTIHIGNSGMKIKDILKLFQKDISKIKQDISDKLHS